MSRLIHRNNEIAISLCRRTRKTKLSYERFKGLLDSLQPFSTSSKSTAENETSIVKNHQSSLTKLAMYADLAKARLSLLVVTTGAAGYVAAAGPVLTSDFALCMVGTALCSSSAAAFNQIFEIDRDSRMKRTQTRPLVTGSLSTAEAKAAAVVWGVGGTALLSLTNPVTTALGFGNILLYSGLYTYLKPRSMVNTWVGAVVGAIPPLVRNTVAVVRIIFCQCIAESVASVPFLFYFRWAMQLLLEVH